MTTFAKLKTAVDNWLMRDDISVNTEDFEVIMLLAESDIARDVICLMQETSASLVFTGRYADLPENFLEIRNPFIDDKVYDVDYLTPKALRQSSSWNSGRKGKFYTVEGGGGEVGDERLRMVIAAPGSASDPVTIEINYYARFAPLVNDADTNWLLRNHFDVYMYAVMKNACDYIHEFGLAEKYEKKYITAKNKQALHENRKRFTAMPKQSAGSRTVV